MWCYPKAVDEVCYLVLMPLSSQHGIFLLTLQTVNKYSLSQEHGGEALVYNLSEPHDLVIPFLLSLPVAC